MTPFSSIVVLSHSWSGSSIFAGLLHRSGYWMGGETQRTPDFETYESSRLVTLNTQLLRALRPGWHAGTPFRAAEVERIEHDASRLGLQPCRAFVEECAREKFWAWKDPRLAWTVRAWARVTDFSQTAFLTLSRSELQSWITLNKRKQVQSWSYTRKYHQAINASNQAFAQAHGAKHLHLTLEDLLLEPEATLEQLNVAFGLFLTMDDLQAVCRLPLYRKRRDWRDFAEALSVYLKNYHARDGRGFAVAGGEAA